MGIEGAFISINIKSSERKSSMLEKSMGKSALMVALVTGNVIWWGYTVHAEEPNQVFTLDPMVVTATRTEKRDVDVPASTTILTSEDLKATGAQNLQVALGRVPGLIYKTFDLVVVLWGQWLMK